MIEFILDNPRIVAGERSTLDSTMNSRLLMMDSFSDAALRESCGGGENQAGEDSENTNDSKVPLHTSPS